MIKDLTEFNISKKHDQIILFLFYFIIQNQINIELKKLEQFHLTEPIEPLSGPSSMLSDGHHSALSGVGFHPHQQMDNNQQQAPETHNTVNKLFSVCACVPSLPKGGYYLYESNRNFCISCLIKYVSIPYNFLQLVLAL